MKGDSGVGSRRIWTLTPKSAVTVSICTTNYNCAHALPRHLSSIYRALQRFPFEYIVVDNKSTDGSLGILMEWASSHENMTVRSLRCTMGEGRQVAFSSSVAQHIMVVDTDVVYDPILTAFTRRYLDAYLNLSVQALFCGIFPRDQWVRIGGRRSLNTNEDLDMWFRLLQLGTMRWYPVQMGEHLKEPWAEGSADYRSARYSRPDQIFRLFRREWDLFKTRRLNRLDLSTIIQRNTLDMALGPAPGTWPGSRKWQSLVQRAVQLTRELKQVSRKP